MPSRVITSVWPCDSPAVRNLSIRAQFYIEEIPHFRGSRTRTPRKRARARSCMEEGMSRLLHDRYYAYAAEHAWDLATGESVSLTDMTPPLPTSTALADALVEVLDHGREGEPRWVVVETGAGAQSLAVARRIAEHARLRGLVPIAVDVYLRLRTLLEEELKHRTLMLILGPGSPLDPAREAMIAAAAASPRPHVLVSFRCIRTPSLATVEDRGNQSYEPGHIVREARAVYGAGI